jgi:hypothetical protein
VWVITCWALRQNSNRANRNLQVFAFAACEQATTLADRVEADTFTFRR